ncbi:hypothetical protein [Methanobrevibacter sp.]
MKLEELLDLTLREVLEDYVAVNNLECGYYYGVFKGDDINRIFEEFNIEEDYPEAFHVENLINDELIVSFDEEIKDYNKLLKIMKNLGVSSKK